MVYKEKQLLDNVTTTDSYQDSETFGVHGFQKALLWLKNTGGSNSLNYKVFGRQELHSDWEELKGETELAAGATAVETSSDPWWALKIQVASAVSETPTTCDAYGSKK